MASMNEVSLSGKGMQVVYDTASGRAAITRAGGERLVGNIAFDGDSVGAATKTKSACGRLGEFSALSIVRANGTVDEILASPRMPFVLFRRTLKNNSSEPSNVRSLPLLSFEASWASDGRSLKTMGTGGLMSPEESPGSYMWMAVAEPQTRHGLVGGWITSDRGGGAVLSSRKDGLAKVSAHIDYGRLIIPPGKEEVSEVFALGWFDDARLGMEAWADTVAKAYDIHLPPQPVGYCTWNDGNERVNEYQVAFRASQASAFLKPFGFSVIQIDHGWHWGPPSWVENREGPFPSGMRAMSDRIRSFGLVPGIWVCPFSAGDAKNLQSDPPNPGWFSPGLDLTNPAAIDQVKTVFKRLSEEYGYSYFKMDAFSMGLIDDGYNNEGWKNPRAFSYQPPNEDYWKAGKWRKVHDPLMTPFQAHRAGVKAIRETVGKDAFLLGCGAAQSMSMYGASFGAIDSLRIGSDNNPNFYPKDLQASIAGIQYNDPYQVAHRLHGPIAGSRNYHLNRRVWYNDPDQACNDLQLLSWVALSDSLYIVGDALDFSGEPLGGVRKADRYQKTIPNHCKTTRPVDLFESPLPRAWIVTDGEGESRRDVVGFFNWNPDGKSVAIEESLGRMDVPEGLKYAAYDFWEDRFVGLFDKTVKVSVAPKSCTVLALRAWREHPMVLSTSRHITQGMIDVSGERWDASSQVLSGTSKVVGGFAYELRIYAPAGTCGKALEALVSEEDRVAGAGASISAAGDIVRVKIDSGTSREVRWSVRFGK